MKIMDNIIDNGFYKVESIEVYDKFYRFVVDTSSISDDLKLFISEIMCSEPYEEDDELFLSVIVPYNKVLDFGNAILHISEISHTLREEYVKQLNEVISNNNKIPDSLGIKVEFNTIELVNLLSAA